jgi:hypothetical protein
MASSYKILGQALLDETSHFEYECPASTNTVISLLKLKNISYPATVDVIFADTTSSVTIDGGVITQAPNECYLIKDYEILFDDEISINGGIALTAGQNIYVKTTGDQLIVQLYGAETPL